MGLWNWLFGGRANELATPTSPLEPPAPAGPAWQNSENGNPTTIIGRIRLTVFPQDNGWKFCIANVDDSGEPHFSDIYASEAAAREDGLAAVRGEPSRHRPLWVDGAENRRRRMEAELDMRAATIEDQRAWLSGNPDAGISALRKPEAKIRSQLRQLDWHVGELERLGASASVVTGAREQSRILSDLADEVAARLAAKQAQRKPRTAPAVQSLLPPGLAGRVDQVIALLADTPPLAEADRAERHRRAHAAAFERMLTEGTSYNQAAGGPEFLTKTRRASAPLFGRPTRTSPGNATPSRAPSSATSNGAKSCRHTTRCGSRFCSAGRKTMSGNVAFWPLGASTSLTATAKCMATSSKGREVPAQLSVDRQSLLAS